MTLTRNAMLKITKFIQNKLKSTTLSGDKKYTESRKCQSKCEYYAS